MTIENNIKWSNKYDVILADPPWHYNDKAGAGKRGVEFKYNVLTDEEIMNLSVDKIASDNCLLFLWSTAPKMDIAIETMKKWGFEYKTVGFVWVKSAKSFFQFGKPHFKWAMGCVNEMG